MSENVELCAVEREIIERGSFASVTKGTSMRPLFRTHRDMIVVSKIENPLKKYDIILYRGQNGEYILHRIIGFRGETLVVRGDNTYFKELITSDRVIGILTAFNRKGKSGSPNSFSFKLYSRVWRYIYPLRYLFVKAKGFLLRVKRRLGRKKLGK